MLEAGPAPVTQPFDERAAPMTDAAIEIDAPAADFVAFGTGEVNARTSVIDLAINVLSWPTFIDRDTWELTK
ncbi:MAG: hypothetical protein O7H39_15355 [Gammaproteobacteria bacterium]|nr:hypothetical protein [Gammaproteobacteria bacterium]